MFSFALPLYNFCENACKPIWTKGWPLVYVSAEHLNGERLVRPIEKHQTIVSTTVEDIILVTQFYGINGPFSKLHYYQLS